MWDIEELEFKLKKLKTILKHETSIEKREEIVRDICKLEEIICYIKPINSKFKEKLKNNLYYEELNNHVNAKKENIVNRNYNFLFDLCLNNEVKYPMFLKKNKVTQEQVLDIIFEFLKSYDISLTELLHKLLKENKVYFCNKKNILYNALGEEYYLPTDGSHYICFLFKNKLNNASVLMHEIIHAHQTEKRNGKEYLNLFYSLFLETYSKFIEYAFADYLRENGYNSISKEINARLIDGFNVITDYYVDKFLNIKNLEYKNGYFYDDKGHISFKNIRNLYSDLLAMYFISEYRKDKIQGLKLVNDFDKQVGRVDDRQLLEKYSNEMFKDGYNSCVQYHIKHY